MARGALPVAPAKAPPHGPPQAGFLTGFTPAEPPSFYPQSQRHKGTGAKARRIK